MVIIIEEALTDAECEAISSSTGFPERFMDQQSQGLQAYVPIPELIKSWYIDELLTYEVEDSVGLGTVYKLK